MLEFLHDYYKETVEKKRISNAKMLCYTRIIRERMTMVYGLLGYMSIVIDGKNKEDAVKDY